MKHRKEKSPRIGSAVIRGRRDRYEFEVFPLDVEMQPVAAVYVISRRVIDREGRGHHKFVCIGQTESLAFELKKQKKGKCIKKFKANVVSVLPTESEKSRFSIEADLKAAHAIPCLLEPANAERMREPIAAEKNVGAKNEKKAAKTASQSPAKPASLKATKMQNGKASESEARKIKPQKRQAVKVKQVLLAEADKANGKKSGLKKDEKAVTPKTKMVGTAKPKAQPPKKAEPVKSNKVSTAKSSAPKAKKAAAKEPSVSETAVARAGSKVKIVVELRSPKKAKVAPIKQSGETVSAKPKASKSANTASKNELQTTKPTRKTVAAAVESRKTTGEKKKAETPAAKGETNSKPRPTRKRLAI